MPENILVLLLTSLFISNAYAVEPREYVCAVDSVYVMADGMSSDEYDEEDHQQLVVKINADDVKIESAVEGIESGDLKLIVNTDFEIVAINKSMQYSYSITTKKFSLTTGIGKSGFKSGVGHFGNQMLIYGKCTE
jgi:hypothetical protein